MDDPGVREGLGELIFLIPRNVREIFIDFSGIAGKIEIIAEGFPLHNSLYFLDGKEGFR
jgi:hypothetical protein